MINLTSTLYFLASFRKYITQANPAVSTELTPDRSNTRGHCAVVAMASPLPCSGSQRRCLGKITHQPRSNRLQTRRRTVRRPREVQPTTVRQHGVFIRQGRARRPRRVCFDYSLVLAVEYSIVNMPVPLLTKCILFFFLQAHLVAGGQ